MKVSTVYTLVGLTAALTAAASAQGGESSDKSSSGLKVGNGANSVQVYAYVRSDAVFNFDSNVDHPSGTAIPTAKIGIKGKIDDKWSYLTEFDFGDSQHGKIKDAYLGYKASDSLKLLIGQSKDQTSLEFRSSIKYRAFPDRALNASLLPKRRAGLSAIYSKNNLAASFQVTGEDVSVERADDEGYAVTGRFSYAPILSEKTAWHVGVGGVWLKPDEETHASSFKAFHEGSVTQTKSAYTDKIKYVKSNVVLNFETFAKTGPLWIMGEYTQRRVNRDITHADLDFSAWYVQAGWVLAGGNRSYSPASGVGGLKVKSPVTEGGPGALELAVRYDTLDLNDGVVFGGKVDRYAVNLTWYPVKKLQFRATLQATDARDRVPAQDDKPTTLILRATWSI
jgi:phosphate-selective porin OprO and OprP